MRDRKGFCVDKSFQRFAIAGLGKRGNLALNALRAGFQIVGVDPKRFVLFYSQQARASQRPDPFKMKPLGVA
jgi:hypothetical protein